MQKHYSKTISELYELQQFSVKMGLENISSLCKKLNDPHLSFPVIHVAGTNGKGSTSFIIHNILTAHGLKVGLYTSPHLIDFRERIRVNFRYIDEKYIIEFWEGMRNTVYQIKATFFDTTTALAFDYFRKSKVDVAVIETGLGGRLDSTNIVQPIASVITPIAVDHIKQLGRSLKSIAREKMFIVKKESIFFSGRQKKSVQDLFTNALSPTHNGYYLSRCINIHDVILTSTHSQFDCYDKIRNIKIKKLKLNLAGRFQIDNACLSYLVSRWYLERLGISFSEQTFREGLNRVQWNGRIQQVSKQPDIYLDVSHNYSGFKATIKFIQEISDFSNRSILIGLLADKEYKLIVRLVAKNFKYLFLTEPAHEKALPVSVLYEEFLRHQLKPAFNQSLYSAYMMAINQLGKNDQLFVMGSHFLIGELLREIGKKHLTQ